MKLIKTKKVALNSNVIPCKHGKETFALVVSKGVNAVYGYRDDVKKHYIFKHKDSLEEITSKEYNASINGEMTLIETYKAGNNELYRLNNTWHTKKGTFDYYRVVKIS